MEYMTEQEIDRLSTQTGRQLAREPRVRITIRAERGEPFWEGGVNGHFFRIRTETPVEVPQSLAALIAESARVRREAESFADGYAASGGKRVG